MASRKWKAQRSFELTSLSVFCVDLNNPLNFFGLKKLLYVLLTFLYVSKTKSTTVKPIVLYSESEMPEAEITSSCTLGQYMHVVNSGTKTHSLLQTEVSLSPHLCPNR